MFYLEYLQNRWIREKLTRKLEQKKQQQNAPVTVEDLVVFYPNSNNSYGESKANSNQYDTIDMVPRLIDHLKSLSQIANLYHQQAYCEPQLEGGYQLKKEHLNTITRLSLNEFSLYRKRPLTLDEFIIVLKAIEELVKKCHYNVHLLLSSFSVVNEAGKILNITLYAQGGQDDKIDTIAKGVASNIDVPYRGTTNFSQQTTGKFSSHVSSYVVGSSCDETSVSNNSILEITTKSGVRYLQAVDICFDHANKHSKRLIDGQFDRKDIDTTHFVPEQVDHIVTSNSIDLEDSAKISPSVLHIDPRPSSCFDEENITRPINKKRVLSSEDLQKISHYPEMTISSLDGGISVNNPSFGSDYCVKVFNERKLGGFVPIIASKATKMNKQIMARQLDDLMDTYLMKKGYSQEFHDLEMKNLNSYGSAKKLMEQLEKQSKPTFFEFIFRTENYYTKQKVKYMIRSSADILKAMNDGTTSLAILSPWIRDLQWRLSLFNTPLPNSLTKKLQESAAKFQQQIANNITEDLSI